MTPTPDPLVRAALRAGHVSAGPHPDAEVLGLYAERGLEGDEWREVEAHVAACVRCRGVVADLAITAPAAASAGAAGAPGWLAWFSGWRLLMPVASVAAVAAIAVWLGQPAQDRPAPGPADAAPARDEARANAIPPPPPPAAAAAEAPPAVATPPAVAARALRPEPEPTAAARVQEAPTVDTGVASAAAPPARAADAGANMAKVASAEARAPAAAPMLARQAEATAGAPADAARARPAAAFRVTGGRLERSVDEGRTWRQAATPGEVPIVAVAEVSPSVAWAITDDAVLRTVDGETWAPVRGPRDAPFAAITASDGARATVTTVAGVSHATDDGGATWRRLR